MPRSAMRSARSAAISADMPKSVRAGRASVAVTGMAPYYQVWIRCAILAAMDWPGGRRGRALAAVYVLAWAGVVTGALSIGTSERVTTGFVLWVAASALIWALAVGMRHRVPTQLRPTLGTGYQRAWYRLMLGIELPRALRAIRGKH